MLPVGKAQGKPSAGDSRLCLNAIVKNEMANLPRMLESVAPWISCWVICDTGSTDGTQMFIRDFFGARGIPGDLHRIEFRNFGQARNEALAYCEIGLQCDYLLLVDADMELVVEDRARLLGGLTGPAHMLLQRSGDTSYWNTRLLRCDARAAYIGVTHEYLDVEGEVTRIEGAWFRDHASGSNRPNKLERDIALLTEGLKHEPENARYWFYRARSFMDLARFEEAAADFEKAATLSSWDEERWRSTLELSRCLRALGR